MTTKRAFALLSSLVAALALTLGSATAAQAGHKNYPPPPPPVQVDHGRIPHGDTVHASGNFGRNEKVVIIVTFRATNSRSFKTIRTVVVTTNRKGQFSVPVRSSGAGTLVIHARGNASHRSGAATVTVFNSRGGSSHGRQGMRRASYTVGSLAGSSSGTAGLGMAGLLLLVGAAGFARQTIRRRRRA